MEFTGGFCCELEVNQIPESSTSAPIPTSFTPKVMEGNVGAPGTSHHTSPLREVAVGSFSAHVLPGAAAATRSAGGLKIPNTRLPRLA